MCLLRSQSGKSASSRGKPGKTSSRLISLEPEEWPTPGSRGRADGEEILAVHRRFVHDSNVQRNFAHESREDGCHRPAEVLGGQTGTMYPPSVLDRILFATRDIRH
jgi:hypothetical protein